MRENGILILAVALAGCATTPAASDPADSFLARLSALCGRSFAGTLVTQDAADADMAGKALVIRAGPCERDEVRIAFDVGDDRSRTWIVTRTREGLRLKHRHLLADGSEDRVSQYGGDSASPGSAARQAFPADGYSRAMFTREGRAVSITNVWAFDLVPGTTLTYELARPGRLFRVRFDLTRPL